MYPIRPPAIYIHERVYGDPRAMGRMARLMSGITCPEPAAVVDDRRLDQISRDRGWSTMGRKRTGELGRKGDPILVLDTLLWPTEAERAERRERFPHLRHGRFPGEVAFGFRNGRATLAAERGVCQNGFELHMAWGCLHRCDYCNVGESLHLMLNVEEFVERLDPLVREHPECRLWKFDNHSDIPTLEPEFGATAALAEYFAARPDQYLMLYTKSDNVDYLLSLPYRSHTIVCWTLSSETVAQAIEEGTPSTAARIQAIAKCQRAGYPVRVRFSPIVPVRDWRIENAQMVERLFDSARIDLVTMDMFKHIDPCQVGDVTDVSLWDPEFAGQVQTYAAMRPEDRPVPVTPNGKQLFPHEARLVVYRFLIECIRQRSPSTRVALCGETPEMWAALKPELGMSPEDYVCACGPTSVPGHPLLRPPKRP